MTTIEWVRGPDGSEGLSWNCLRAVVKATGKSANHCEHVNEACRFCYADRTNPRFGGLPFKPGHRKDYDFVVDQKKLTEPLRRKKPTRIFVESMSDAFGEWWQTEYIDQLYAVMATTPQHTYINLSKRPERRRQYLDDKETYYRVHTALAALPGATWHGGMEGLSPYSWPLPNVIEGTSVSSQPEADEFVPILLATNAAFRAVSAEPLLGPIQFNGLSDGAFDALRGESWRPGAEGVRYDIRKCRPLDWLIVGGESGQQARPMHPQWARDIRNQCSAAGVAFFFKQWGEFGCVADLGFGGREHCKMVTLHDPYSTAMIRVGKKAAGRLLDGRTHDEFPEVRTKIIP